MTSWSARLMALFLLSATSMLAIRPVISYRTLELGGGAVEVGMVAGAYAALSLLLVVPMGRWVDRVGEARFLVAGAVLATMTAVALTAVTSIPLLAVAQALLGLGGTVTLLGVQTLLANGGSPSDRDRRIGWYTALASIAQIVGPTAAGVLYETTGSAAHVFVAGALATAGAAGLGITFFTWPPDDYEGRRVGRAEQGSVLRSVGAVLGRPGVPHAMVASMAVLTCVDLLIAYLPLYGESRGIGAGAIGLLLGVRGAAGLVSRLLMVRMIAAIGRLELLVASMALAAVVVLVVPLTAVTGLLFVLLAAAGFGLGLGQPLSLAWIADQVGPEARGTAMGVRLTGNRGAQLLIPMAVGVVAGAAGVGAIFATMSVMLGAGAVWVSRAPVAGAGLLPERGR